MHHFPPFQPSPKGPSTTSISMSAPDTPPPSPPSPCPPPSSPLGRRARGPPPPPRPRRRATPTEEADPCLAPASAPLGPGRRAAVPTLAELEEEVCSRSREAAARPPRLRPAKRTRPDPAPGGDNAVAWPPSPPPSPPPPSAAAAAPPPPLLLRPPARRGTRPQGEPAPPLRSALRTPAASSPSSASTPAKPRKTVRFAAAAAPDTQFFAAWDAPASLQLLRRTPGRAVPEPGGGGGGGGRNAGSRGDGGRDPLPPSPPPAWHWQLRTPGLQAAAAPPSASAASPPPAVQLRDLFLGARRRPPVVLGLVSVARGPRSGAVQTPTAAAGPGAPRRAVVCEGTRDGGRTWAAARAGAVWFCAAPRCDWFQFALDAAGLGLLGGAGAAASRSGAPPHTPALRIRYRDEDGHQWVDDNHGAGFEVRLELCRAGPADGDDDDDDGEGGTAPEEPGWDE